MEERLGLIDAIWDSASAETGDPGLEHELEPKLDKRLRAADACPDAAIPQEEAKRTALLRLSR